MAFSFYPESHQLFCYILNKKQRQELLRKTPETNNCLIISFLLQVENNWEIYACGKTQDQLDLTQLAHKYLRKSTLKPRSLNF